MNSIRQNDMHIFKFNCKQDFIDSSIHFPLLLLCLWVVCTQNLSCFLNICCPNKKEGVSKFLSWIKLINLGFEKGYDAFSIFFPLSTMWPVQSRTAMTAGGLHPHMANMFKRGILLIVAPSLIQLSPNKLAFSVITLLLLSDCLKINIQQIAW